MAAPRKVDYDRIEPGWRAGIKSPPQLAAEYTKETGVSVSNVAIIKHFKKLGVPRDLSAKVRAKADAMVMGGIVTSKVAPITKARESEIVAAAAGQQAEVRLSHRTDASRSRKLFIALLEELEVASAERVAIEDLGDALHKLESGSSPTAANKAREVLARMMSIPSRVTAFKSLTDSLRTLVGVEREAWGLQTDPGPTDPANPDEEARDRNLHTIEQLSARLAGPTPSTPALLTESAVDPEPDAGADA